MDFRPVKLIPASEDAFSAFYEHEHDGQVRRAYLMLGSVATAHDVVAEAFTQVLRRWSTIDAPGPYLNRCVLNGCHDAGRRAGREIVSNEPSRVVSLNGDEPTHMRSTLDSVHDIDLVNALRRLPFKQRAALVLRYYGGASENQIADSLQCQPGTVGSLVHRGLAALRTELTS